MADQTLPIHGTTSDGAAVSISEVPLGHLYQIAGWDDFDAQAQTILEPLTLPLPQDYRRPLSVNGATGWRIAPDRILLRTETAQFFATTAEVATLDLGDARIALHLTGAGAADLLARVVALDFHAEAFPTGTFAQTAMHHIGVLIERKAEDCFLLLVPTTWARSLVNLLGDHLARPRSAA